MATALARRHRRGIVGAGDCRSCLFDNLLGAAGGLVLGASIPILYLSHHSLVAPAADAKQLPNALQAVADAVRGGQTLSEACELVSKEIKGPLGQEFALSPISNWSWVTRRSA